MLDKNGATIETGNRVVDVHGTVGVMTDVGGAMAIKFELDGEDKYIMASKIVSNEICIIGDK